jgi:hypothetical protein
LAFQAVFPTCDHAMRPRASDIDRVLRAERLNGRSKRLHDLTSPAAGLPDGAIILQDGAPHLILNGLARRWSLRGYSTPEAPLDGARLITPPSIVGALRAGYRPCLDASAFRDSGPNCTL